MRLALTLSTLLVLTVTNGSCTSEAPPTGVTTPATSTARSEAPLQVTLYSNAVIWTGAENASDASVMVVEGGDITYVGDGANIRVAADRTVDLEGRFVMPGFIDSHVHFYDGGMGLASVDLRDAATPEIFTKRIVDHVNTLEDDQWVLIGNWDHENWGGELPRKQWIDEDTSDTPVFIYRIDGHMALANSAALKLAGIDADTVTPRGGEIVRDASGEPTGILKDTAMNMVLDVIPKLSSEELLQAFKMAQDHALSVGLTQVHAVSAGPHEMYLLDAFRYARDRGAMKLRVNVFSPIESWEQLSAQIDRDGLGDERLRWGGVKGLVDGSLGSTTAWFHDPYIDEPDKSGFPLIEAGRLKTLLTNADEHNLQLAIHAIGDKAIDELLDDMEQVAGDQIASRRYRIEHFQHPTPEAIERLAKDRIIAAMQPYHAIDDGRWAEGRIGPERIRTTYAFRSILDAGGVLSFGSDWPVAPLSPLEGVYAAVTRRTTDGAHPQGWQPQEKITVEEALTAYTATNAYAVFEEQRGGTLEPGKRADFVVLSHDPREINPESIRDIEVVQTVIAGEQVYQSAP